MMTRREHIEQLAAEAGVTISYTGERYMILGAHRVRGSRLGLGARQLDLPRRPGRRVGHRLGHDGLHA